MWEGTQPQLVLGGLPGVSNETLTTIRPSASTLLRCFRFVLVHTEVTVIAATEEDKDQWLLALRSLPIGAGFYNRIECFNQYGRCSSIYSPLDEVAPRQANAKDTTATAAAAAHAVGPAAAYDATANSEASPASVAPATPISASVAASSFSSIGQSVPADTAAGVAATSAGYTAVAMQPSPNV
eukprot:5619623-Pleurochrysis_carterae.AAC.1